MTVQYQCADEERRAKVQGSTLNGIDFLEVADRDRPSGVPRQQLLVVRMLNDISGSLSPENVEIEGGVRIDNVKVSWALRLEDVTDTAITAHFSGEAHPKRVFLVFTDSNGDYSTYTLRLVDPLDDEKPPAGFDARLS